MTWNILCDTAIYIMIGFAIAAALHAWVTSQWAMRSLSRPGTRSVFLATIVGLPLPLCSCGVLPTAIALRRKGASKGATLSFLISTPETSVPSLILSYSLLGPLFTAARLIVSAVTAISAGIAQNIFEPYDDKRTALPVAEPAGKSETAGEHSCRHSNSEANPQHDEPEKAPGLRAGLRFAFVQLFDDIFLWIIVGVVAAGAIRALVPPSVFATVFGDPYFSPVLMLLVGIPLYVCAEASTPVAAALLAQGVNPGAALVLLLVGPATNIGSIGALVKELGRRTIVVYLITIAIVALVAGFGLNALIASPGISAGTPHLDEHMHPSLLKVAAAVLFLAMGVLTFYRKRYLQRVWHWTAGWFHSAKPAAEAPAHSCCAHTQLEIQKPAQSCCSHTPAKTEAPAHSCCSHSQQVDTETTQSTK